MADRFLLKKFASETNDVGQFGSFQATGGNIGDGVKTTDPDLIQSLPAWKAGWGNAVDNGLLLPRLEEMNGVQRVFAEMLWNQWRDGITFWQAGAPVKALQSIVMYQTGDEFPKLYINKTGVNGTNPPPQDTDNWKPLSDFFVTTDTAQTITGTKTFEGVVTAELESINFIAKNPTMDVNETPQSRKYVGYDFRDKNNVRIGYIGISQGTDGQFQYEIQKLGNYAKKMIGITPPANSAGGEIVTAEWFNSKMQVVSALPANPDPNVFYFIPE